MTKKRLERMKIDMPFEDAVRHILKAGPMPKALRPKSKRRKLKPNAKAR
jgi:hypothetical protein